MNWASASKLPVIALTIFCQVASGISGELSGKVEADKLVERDQLFTESWRNLSQLTSFHCKGRFRREYSEKIVNASGLDKSSFTDEVEIWASGDSFRVRFDRDAVAADPINILDITVTTDKIYSVESGERSVGYVRSRRNESDFEGLEDLIVPLLPYSFLAEGHGFGGLNPFSLTLGHENPNFSGIVDFKSSFMDEKLSVSFERGNDRWVIQIDRFNERLVPLVVEYFTKFEGIWYIAREVEVSNYAMFGKVGPIAQSVQVKCYEINRNERPSDRESTLSATVKFDLDLFEINQKVDSSVFEVDFASLDSVWDADNEVYIIIPK